jgi:pyridoxamine 5'-phosphate oxidase
MPDPIYLEAVDRFREKLAQTSELPMREPKAMSLATVSADGRPSVRVVLLRGFDERGFVFFTNSLSRKGQQMAANKNVALAFYWDDWAEQVHVEGQVQKIVDAESDEYWVQRARLSRIGAWASQQSQPLDSHETLLNKVAELEEQYKDNVPRPEHWHGFRVIPSRIEFWSGRDGRLHKRDVYEQSEDQWTKGMLYP